MGETPQAGEQAPVVVETVRLAHEGERIPRPLFIKVYCQAVAGCLGNQGAADLFETHGYRTKDDSVGQRASQMRTQQGIALPFMPKGGGVKFDKVAAQSELEAAMAEFGIAPAKVETVETPADGEKTEAPADQAPADQPSA